LSEIWKENHLNVCCLFFKNIRNVIRKEDSHDYNVYPFHAYHEKTEKHVADEATSVWKRPKSTATRKR